MADIFGQTPVPKWISPEEDQLRWRQQNLSEAEGQSLIASRAAQIGIDQQKLNLMSQAQGVDMIQKGIAIQGAQRDLQMKTDGLDEWHNLMSRAGDDQEGLYTGKYGTPTTPYAIQIYNEGAQAWHGSESGQAYQDYYLQQTQRRTGQIKEMNDPKFQAALDDLVSSGEVDPNADGLIYNADGSPKKDRWGQMIDPSVYRQVQARQTEMATEAQERIRRAGPEITAGSREKVAQINQQTREFTATEAAQWHTEAARIMADSRTQSAQIRSDGQLRVFQSRRVNDASKLLDDATLAAFKADANAITLDPKIATAEEKASAIQAVFENVLEAHSRAVPAAQAATPAAQPNAPAKVKVKDANGNFFMLPADQLGEAIKQGYRQVQ